MKSLTIIRHAKSDWGHDGLADIDRPLNQRGYTDAYALAKWLTTQKRVPTVLLSSSAVRAISTAFIFARALQIDAASVMINPSIYESTEIKLHQLLTQLPSSVSDVALFGHNPSITNLCNHYSTTEFFDNVPTCGIVQFQWDAVNWTTLETAQLNFFKYPKQFNA